MKSAIHPPATRPETRPSRPAARLRPLAALLLALAVGGPAVAQGGAAPLPADAVRLEGGAVVLTTPAFRDSYVPGIGWLSGRALPAPIVTDGAVLAPPELLRALGPLPDGPPARAPVGVTPAPAPAPRTPPATRVPSALPPGAERVRFGGSGEVRVVVDLPELPDASTLRPLEGAVRLEPGGALRLRLPGLDLPDDEPEPYRGVDVRVAGDPLGTAVVIRGPEASGRVMALEDPVRLVIDLVPLAEVGPPEERELRPGVTYRSFAAETAAGASPVHVLEFAPGSGEFRVVGTSEVPRTLEELASGAFAAINAGYFDTATFRAIGLLRVDHGLQSFPSRNRASIAFAPDGPVVARVSGEARVRVGGRLYRAGTGFGADPELRVVAEAGALAGDPVSGVVVVEGGRVRRNAVGPLRVPPRGFALSYPPENRALAAVEPGETASLAMDFEPDAFDVARYAVEAGPLLVQEGRPAFRPEEEAFARGQRILDAVTRQSAVGVRADGTVLFVMAELMRAEDLVPLMLRLGARDAMRLDSGGSASLFADGRVLTDPNARRIVSAIVFVPHGG